jgi:hypothetical protein
LSDGCLSMRVLAGTLTVLSVLTASGARPYAQTQAVRSSNCSFSDGPAERMSPAAAAETNAGRISEAVRLDKRIVNKMPHPERQVPSFESLIRQSDAIVVGSVIECTGVDAKFRVDTIYRISVEDVLKGSVLPRDVILVQFPGGRLDYPGGSAETRVTDFTPPQVKDRLTVFLRRQVGASNEAPGFSLSVGQWSSFRLPERGGLVEPSYKWSPEGGDTVVSLARRMTTSDFLQKLRELLKKSP